MREAWDQLAPATGNPKPAIEFDDDLVDGGTKRGDR